MNSAGVVFHPAAAEELEAAVEWYLDRSQVVAVRFAHEIDNSIALLVADPLRWPEFHGATRRVLVQRFPYAVVYQRVADRIEILAVAHCSRKPGYWKDRASH